MLEILTLRSSLAKIQKFIYIKGTAWTSASISVCFTHRFSAGSGSTSVGDGASSMVKLCVVLAEGQ